MTHDEICAACVAICCAHLGVAKEACTDAAYFEDDLNADSLDRIELATLAEEQFKIEVGDQEMYGIYQFRDMVDLIAAKVVQDAPESSGEI